MTVCPLLVFVFLVLTLGAAAWGHARHGDWSWAPAALLAAAAAALLHTGHLGGNG